VRDVEATIADALGAQATVSKSEVSRICQVIRDELDTWSARRHRRASRNCRCRRLT
jgi:putative transposase